MTKLGVILLQLMLPLSAFAATYYVTPTGAGSGNGTSLANAWSLSQYNSSTLPTGGDTVYFSGSFTSSVIVPTSGTGNGANRLTLDFTQATVTLQGTGPAISINGQAYINLNGGTFGTDAGDANQYDLIDFGFLQSHDVTIQNWTYNGPAGGETIFVDHQYCYNSLIQNNHIVNCGIGISGDSIYNHDITILNNYIQLSVGNGILDIDCIAFGDVHNMSIQGNALINPAVSSLTGHQDCIQTYFSGSSNPAYPYNWIVCYNWIESADATGGSGDNSFMIMENMIVGPSGEPSCTIYGNVFCGSPTANTGNNGVTFDDNASNCLVYFYNNTVIINPNAIPAAYGAHFEGAGTLYAENNIICSLTSVQYNGNIVMWTFTEGLWDYNYIYNGGSWPTQAGTHGSSSANPNFYNAANYQFWLAAGSPLIGAGDSTIGSTYNQGIAPNASWPNPALVTRTTGAWDVGAYQSPPQATPTPASTPAAPQNLHIVVTPTPG